MLGRAVAWNVFGQVGVLSLGFVSSLLVARWLGPEDRGLLAVVAYTAEIVVAVAGIGLTYAVVYFVSRTDSRPGAVLGNSLLYGLGLAAVFAPAFALLRGPISELTNGRGQTAWALAGVFVPLLFLDWCIHNQLFGRLRFGLLNLFLVGSRVVVLGLAVLLVGIADYGVAGALVSVMGASLALIVATLVVILPDVRPSLDLPLLREMIGYGARVSVGWIFQILNYRADVLMLQILTTLTSVGYYVVAQIVAELTLTFAAALQSSVTALTASAEGDPSQDETTIASLRHQTLLTSTAIVLVAIGGPALVHFGYGAAFDDAIVPMLILLAGMLPLGAGAVVTGNLRGRGKPGISSVLAGVTVVVTLALDLVLIPPYGVTGAAIASVCAYWFYGVASILVLARITGIAPRTLVLPTGREVDAYRRFARAALRRPASG
ncbi:MAG: polysaccharide biosynthesis C-terminal domain-containing protein [Gaiellaceae bacterium MAG52_C11]|nr:polysaccharide biosynthesis C-terminal domain-containing protein [Candidatus Gaiellasilicea maunaloa]